MHISCTSYNSCATFGHVNPPIWVYIDNFNLDPTSKKSKNIYHHKLTSYSTTLHPSFWFLCFFSFRKVDAVDISVPEVFLGGIAGATLVFYFSGQCMTAVGPLGRSRQGLVGSTWGNLGSPRLAIGILPDPWNAPENAAENRPKPKFGKLIWTNPSVLGANTLLSGRVAVCWCSYETMGCF